MTFSFTNTNESTDEDDGNRVKTVFICGAVSSMDDPFSWQDELSESDEYENYEFVNPYQLGDDVDDPYDNPDEIMEPALNAVRDDADALLVRWEDDAFLVAAVVYMKEAFDTDIPIVVWYDGYRDQMQIPLSYMLTSYHEDRDTALSVIRALLGDTDQLVE